MKNTEIALIEAITEGLMAEPIQSHVLSTEGTYAAGDRRICIDYGTLDIGPIIGAAGATKLAIQTLLACPFGGDNCHMVLHSTRERRESIKGHPDMLEPRLQKILAALKDHLHGSGRFEYRVETSQTATVVLVEASNLLVDTLRGALSKLVRAIGRKHRSIAVVSIETPAMSDA